MPPTPASVLAASLFPVPLPPQLFPLLSTVLNTSPSDSHQDSEQEPAPLSSKPALTDSPLYGLAGDLARHPLCVGLISVSALAVLAGSRQMANGLDQLGSWGEELFRGDRLPLLHNSAADSATNSAEGDAAEQASS
ncbi:MAG: hypothetical protein AAGA67_02840 [Cyanobacteria bacterium P01_F01_bin.153]